VKKEIPANVKAAQAEGRGPSAGTFRPFGGLGVMPVGLALLRHLLVRMVSYHRRVSRIRAQPASIGKCSPADRAWSWSDLNHERIAPVGRYGSTAAVLVDSHPRMPRARSSEATDRAAPPVTNFDNIVSGPPADHSSERSGPTAQATLLDRSLELLKVDFAPRHRQPSELRVVAATTLSIVGSLSLDAILVAIGTRIFPSTKGYVHFAFHDYAKLTIIGVLIACAAWPIVTRVSYAQRWLFLRLAILVTLVLVLPDFYLLVKGSNGEAVAILMFMHVAIALVTYNLLVRLAPNGEERPVEDIRARFRPHC
jgi:hypothetical protein